MSGHPYTSDSEPWWAQESRETQEAHQRTRMYEAANRSGDRWLAYMASSGEPAITPEPWSRAVVMTGLILADVSTPSGEQP